MQEPSNSFCTDYQDAWNSFSAIRDSNAASSSDIVLGRDELLKEWENLAKREDAPKAVIATVPAVANDFVQAWNATSSGERSSYQRSWKNRQGFIALRCGKAGHPIEFQGTDIPLRAPA